MSVAIDGRPKWLHATQPFVTGGLAGCLATSCIQPIDMVKVRIQLMGNVPKAAKSPFVVARQVVNNEGFFALYKGLDAGLLRQITYTTARMGLFRVISEYMKPEGEPTLSLWRKGLAGLLAGGLGSLVGTPADLSLIRLQADSTLPIEARRNYTGVIDALSRIAREEGIVAWWRGATPTVARAMALNMGMLASFDQSKEMLDARFGPGWGPTLTASAISGFFAVTFSLPFDFVKTKIQRMKADPITGKLPYRNMADCALKTLKSEGPLAFYAGYLTYYVRIAPHAMITLISLDYVNKWIQNYYAVKQS